MSDLIVHIRTTPAPTLVTIVGELDSVSAPQLRPLLRAVPAADLVLDVHGLRFLDAAGLRVLLELQARLLQAGARLVLAAAPRRVRRVITLAGLNTELTTSQTVDGAVELLGCVYRPSRSRRQPPTNGHPTPGGMPQMRVPRPEQQR